jgi:hypothetical protein
MSGKPVEFHPEVLAEAEAALRWYRERSARGGSFSCGNQESDCRNLRSAGPLAISEERLEEIPPSSVSLSKLFIGRHPPK